jgi:Flp pilus assembly protein TadD
MASFSFPRSARIAVVATLALPLAACANQSIFPPADLAAANVEKPKASTAKSEARSADPALIADAKADPKNADTVIKAARALRAAGQRNEALALLNQAIALQPKHAALAREKGLLALELGQIASADALLSKAIAQGKGDWQTYSALGVALASAGKHQQAQKQFAKALELAPDHPSILNNLALSYALDGKPAEAERILRVAASGKGPPAEVKQNLALVLGARGKLAEAEKLAAADPKANADSNAAYLKSLAERANGAKTADAAIKSADAQKSALAPPYMLGISSGQ